MNLDAELRCRAAVDYQDTSSLLASSRELEEALDNKGTSRNSNLFHLLLHSPNLPDTSSDLLS